MKLSTSDILNLVIGRTTNIVNRNLNRAFKALNLQITHEQWTLLSALWAQDGQTQQSLSAKTYRDKTSVTRLIDKLVKQNLVKRVQDKKDQRNNLICLTPNGRALEHITAPVLTGIYNKASIGIAEKDIITCREVLNRVFENLKDQSPRY